MERHSEKRSEESIARAAHIPFARYLSTQMLVKRVTFSQKTGHLLNCTSLQQICRPVLEIEFVRHHSTIP